MSRETAIAFCDAYRTRDPYISPRIAVYGVPGDARDFWPMWDKEAKRYRHVVEDPDQWAEIVRLQARGNQVFFYLNQIGDGPGQGHNGTATNRDVEQIRSFSVDFDGGLPESWICPAGPWEPKEDRISCFPEPDIVIKTSSRALADGRTVQRGQALWLVSDLEDGQKPGVVTTFARTQQAFAAYYDPEGWRHRKEKNWPHITDKNITDLRRLHRLPGTLHLKDPANPQLVTFERVYGGRRRSASDITARLPSDRELQAIDRAQRPEPGLRERPPVEHNDDVGLLKQVLAYLDPGMPEPEWWECIAAIENSPIGSDAEREWAAIEWSRGEYSDYGQPTNWESDEDVRRKYQRARRSRAVKGPGELMVGFGTLVRLARGAGLQWVPGGADEFDKYLVGERSMLKPVKLIKRLSQVMTMPDPEFLVDGFLVHGEDIAIYSTPKSGKTFLALDISLSIAAGLLVLGKLTVLRPGECVVYLSGEGHAGMKRRIAAWCQDRGVDWQTLDDKFFYAGEVPMSSAGHEEAMRFINDIREECTPVLIVIDTMSRSLGKLNENESASAAQYLEMTKTLRDAFQCTTLTLAHDGKEGSGNGIRGSSAFGGGFDAVWHLQKAAGTGVISVNAQLLKEAEDLGPYSFHLDTVFVQGMENNKGAVVRWDEPQKRPRADHDYRKSESEDEIEATLTQHGAVGSWSSGKTDTELAVMIIGTREEWIERFGEKAAHDEVTGRDAAVLACAKRLYGRHRPNKGKYGPLQGVLGNVGNFSGATKQEWRWYVCQQN